MTRQEISASKKRTETPYPVGDIGESAWFVKEIVYLIKLLETIRSREKLENNIYYIL